MKHFIFDMDGTLLDTMPLWETLGEDFLRLHGKEPKPGFRQQLIALSMVEAAEMFEREYGFTESVPQIVRALDDMARGFYTDKAPAKPGAIEALQFLADNGCPCVVATASDRELAAAAFKRTGMLHFFREIYTCTELGISKDNPAFFQVLLEKEHVTPGQAVVVEDALHAIRSARKENIPVLAIYDDSDKEHWEEIKSLANWSMEDWSQFPAAAFGLKTGKQESRGGAGVRRE